MLFILFVRVCEICSFWDLLLNAHIFILAKVMIILYGPAGKAWGQLRHETAIDRSDSFVKDKHRSSKHSVRAPTYFIESEWLYSASLGNVNTQCSSGIK